MFRNVMLTVLIGVPLMLNSVLFAQDVAKQKAEDSEINELKEKAGRALANLVRQDFAALERQFDPSFAPLRLPEMRERFRGVSKLKLEKFTVKDVEFGRATAIRNSATVLIEFQLSGVTAENGELAFPDYPIVGRVSFTRSRTGSRRQWAVEDIYFSFDHAVIERELTEFYQALKNRDEKQMLGVLAPRITTRPKPLGDLLKFPGKITVEDVQLRQLERTTAGGEATMWFTMTVVAPDGEVVRSPLAQKWTMERQGWRWKAVGLKSLEKQVVDDGPFGF